MRMRLRAYAGLFGWCMVACSAERGPCLDWAVPGDTYVVTLGARSDVPESSSALEPRTCGAGFDLQPQDSFELKTFAEAAPAPTCDLLKATTSTIIRNVALGAGGGHLGGAPTPHMEASFPNATIGERCHGRYDLGLNLSDKLRAYRTFETDEVTACLDETLALTEDDPWCWDSWLVEVRDSEGRVVATTLPR